MSSNPGQIELVVLSTSVLSRRPTWTKIYNRSILMQINHIYHPFPDLLHATYSLDC